MNVLFLSPTVNAVECDIPNVLLVWPVQGIWFITGLEIIVCERMNSDIRMLEEYGNARGIKRVRRALRRHQKWRAELN